jgi:hypothetical protein
VIAAGHIYLTAVEHDRLYTLCLETGSGRVLWKQEAPRSRQEKLHALNSPVSPTPATDGDNVYTFFPDFGLLSYTRDGKEPWRVPHPAVFKGDTGRPPGLQASPRPASSCSDGFCR